MALLRVVRVLRWNGVRALGLTVRVTLTLRLRTRPPWSFRLFPFVTQDVLS